MSTPFRLLLPLLLIPLLSCISEPRGQNHPALFRERGAIKKLAIVPFLRSSDEASLREGAAIIERYFAELLLKKKLLVIPSRDVSIALSGALKNPREAAKICATKFGADSILIGEVRRFSERKGAAFGASVPASVAFDVALYDVSSGRRMWSAIFDERQRSMTENLLVTRRYPGKGSRWLSRAEFAKWGVAEIIDEIPLGDSP